MARHDGLLPSNVSLDAPRASSAWSQQGQQGNGGAGWAEEALRAELLRDATTAGARAQTTGALLPVTASASKATRLFAPKAKKDARRAGAPDGGTSRQRKKKRHRSRRHAAVAPLVGQQQATPRVAAGPGEVAPSLDARPVAGSMAAPTSIEPVALPPASCDPSWCNCTRCAQPQAGACSLCAHKWLFVVATGRSGSTSILEGLNALPGVSLSGENYALLTNAQEISGKTMRLSQSGGAAFEAAADTGMVQDETQCAMQEVFAKIGGGDLRQRDGIFGFKELVSLPSLRKFINGKRPTEHFNSWATSWLDYIDELFPCARIVFNIRRDVTAQARAIFSTFDGASSIALTQIEKEMQAVSDSFVAWHGERSRASGGKARSFLLYTEDFTAERFTQLAQWLGFPCTYNTVPHANDPEARSQADKDAETKAKAEGKWTGGGFFHKDYASINMTCHDDQPTPPTWVDDPPAGWPPPLGWPPGGMEHPKKATRTTRLSASASASATSLLASTQPTRTRPVGSAFTFGNEAVQAQNQAAAAKGGAGPAPLYNGFDASLKNDGEDPTCEGVPMPPNNDVCIPPRDKLLHQFDTRPLRDETTLLDEATLPKFFIHEEGVFNFTQELKCYHRAIKGKYLVDDLDSRLFPDISEHLADMFYLERFRRHPSRVYDPDQAHLHVLGTPFVAAFRAHRGEKWDPSWKSSSQGGKMGGPFGCGTIVGFYQKTDAIASHLRNSFYWQRHGGRDWLLLNSYYWVKDILGDELLQMMLHGRSILTTSDRQYKHFLEMAITDNVHDVTIIPYKTNHMLDDASWVDLAYGNDDLPRKYNIMFHGSVDRGVQTAKQNPDSLVNLNYTEGTLRGLLCDYIGPAIGNNSLRCVAKWRHRRHMRSAAAMNMHMSNLLAGVAPLAPKMAKPKVPDLGKNHLSWLAPTGRRADPTTTRMYTQSTLCLIPAGDTPTSRRLFDAMAAGCIPVLMSPPEGYAPNLPFPATIDWTKVALWGGGLSCSMLRHPNETVAWFQRLLEPKYAKALTCLRKRARAAYRRHMSFRGHGVVSALLYELQHDKRYAPFLNGPVEPPDPAATATSCTLETQCGCAGSDLTTVFLKYDKTGPSPLAPLLSEMNHVCDIEHSKARDGIETGTAAPLDGRCRAQHLAVDPSTTAYWTPDRLFNLTRPHANTRFVHLVREPISFVAAFYAYHMSGAEKGTDEYAGLWALISQESMRDGLRHVARLMMVTQLPKMVEVRRQLRQVSGKPRSDVLELRIEDTLTSSIRDEGGSETRELWRRKEWRSFEESTGLMAHHAGVEVGCASGGSQLHLAFRKHDHTRTAAEAELEMQRQQAEEAAQRAQQAFEQQQARQQQQLQQQQQPEEQQMANEAAESEAAASSNAQDVEDQAWDCPPGMTGKECRRAAFEATLSVAEARRRDEATDATLRAMGIGWQQDQQQQQQQQQGEGSTLHSSRLRRSLAASRSRSFASLLAGVAPSADLAAQAARAQAAPVDPPSISAWPMIDIEGPDADEPPLSPNASVLGNLSARTHRLVPNFLDASDAFALLLGEHDIVDELVRFGRSLGYRYPDDLSTLAPPSAWRPAQRGEALASMSDSKTGTGLMHRKPLHRMRGADCERLLHRASNFLVAPQHRVAWCAPADAPTSDAIVHALGPALNITADAWAAVEAGLRASPTDPLKRAYELKAKERRALCAEGIASFAVVSDPWRRTVAAYMSKVAVADSAAAAMGASAATAALSAVGELEQQAAQLTTAQKLASRQLAAIRQTYALAERAQVSFSQFVRWLAQRRPNELDELLTPEAVRCDAQHVPYSLVARQESLGQDLTRLIELVTLNHTAARGTEATLSSSKQSKQQQQQAAVLELAVSREDLWSSGPRTPLGVCAASSACAAAMAAQAGADWQSLPQHELVLKMYTNDPMAELPKLIGTMFEADAKPFDYSYDAFRSHTSRNAQPDSYLGYRFRR